MASRGTKAPSLLTYIDSLVEIIRKTVPDAINTGDAKAVHQARVTTRRLKAAVDVFKPISSGGHRKELTRILRKLRKSLGPMRDLEVMIGYVKELESDRNKPAVDWIRERLTRDHTKAKQSAVDEIDVAKMLARLGAWWGVREEWANVGEAGLRALLGDSLHLQLDRFIEHADALAGRAGAATDKKLLDPHQLRISGKALRYTLELAIAGGHRLPANVMRAFKRMQDALGLWHDYVVLGDELLENVIGTHDAPLVISVLDLARIVVRRAERKLKTFVELWNQNGQEIAGTIRDVFPLTQGIEPEPVKQSQTDPDPPDLSESPEDSQAPHSQDESSTA